MRVSTAFNKMLAIPGAWVASVTFTPAGIVVGLRRRRQRLRCPCGFEANSRYDASVRRWRHLDLGACKLFLEAEVRRIDCPDCGVRAELVPWARPRARHTRDFEDVVAWLAQRTDMTTVSRLLRCAWRTVGAIVGRVVADHIDDKRLNDLYRIGVDEISYRRGRRYLTLVVDHDRSAVVWAAEGRNTEALGAFYQELGEERCARLEAVSLDLLPAYRKATKAAAPQARMCFDPFHVVRMANEALDAVFASVASPRDLHLDAHGRARLRWALRTGAEKLTDAHLALLRRMRHVRSKLFRAWELKEALRDLYRLVDPREAASYLEAWLTRACRSRIPTFVLLAQRIRKHKDGVIAAVELGLSNSRVEGMNAKVRVIQRRGYGFHSAAALIGMIYLCCGGVTVLLPTER